MVLIRNLDEPFVYKHIKDSNIIILILYVDNNLLTGNDVRALTSVKNLLAQYSDMKDL